MFISKKQSDNKTYFEITSKFFKFPQVSNQKSMYLE